MGLFSRSKNSSSSVYSRNQLSLLESPYGVFFPIETLEFFLYDFKFKFGMNAHPIRPQNLKELPKYFWSYALTRWHTYYDSHYLTSRLTSRPKFIGSWLAYLQKN